MELYFLLKRLPDKWKIAILGVLSFSGIAAIVYNLPKWNTPLEYLPLHLCSLNALVLPFAVLFRNKALCNLLPVWSLGALAANTHVVVYLLAVYTPELIRMVRSKRAACK